MWERAKPETPVAATRQTQVKAALRLPQKHSHEKNNLLQWQLLVCLLTVLAAALLRFAKLPLYETLRGRYRTLAGQAELFEPEHALVRFASNLAQGALSQAGTLWQAAAAGGPTLADGELSENAAPEGYSTETLRPNQASQLPLDSYTLSSGYGWRSDPFSGEQAFHSGIDLAAPQGSQVVPTMAGIVLKAERGTEYGNYLELLHGDGLVTLYAHMEYLFAKAGECVTFDGILGTVGATGNATGPHLHLELWKDNVRYDPSLLLL